MHNSSALSAKLEAVLIRLAKGTDLNVTKAVKLPYLVDVVANRVLGSPITGAKHQAWKQGVVANDAWHYLDKTASLSEVLLIEPVPFSEERKVLAGRNDDSALDDDERAVVDAVIEEFGAMTATELGQMTKLMNPEIRSWGSNHSADLSENAFDRMSAEYQEMVRSLADVRLIDLERDDYEVVTDIEDAIA